MANNITDLPHLTAARGEHVVVGVDGCPAGWLVAWLQPADAVRVELIRDFAGLLGADGPAVIAVDMPIGLPERSGPGGRAAENAIRPLLGNRQSSVFSVPSRSAVYAEDYREACRRAEETSDPPRKVSKQLFAIAPKIREVDAALRAAPEAVPRVFEVHPELAFWRLNGERPLTEPKKIKGRPYPPGLALRRRLLREAGLPAVAVDSIPPAGAGPDDVIDALACAAVAQRIVAGTATSFPDPPPRDAFGLPMAIWA